MIHEESTLTDVCFEVAAALDAYGMSGVLVGGSAATVYAPDVYTSYDVDFILEADDSLADVAVALRSIGFERDGRSRLFVHAKTTFTVDFPKGPLGVGGEYVRETNVLERGEMCLRTLTRFDCVRDRLAHFYHWNDFTALNAAVGVAAQNVDEVDFKRLRTWTEGEGATFIPKLAEFEKRLKRAPKPATARRPARRRRSEKFQ